MDEEVKRIAKLEKAKNLNEKAWKSVEASLLDQLAQASKEREKLMIEQEVFQTLAY